MAQDYTEFPSTEPILASHTKIIDNFKASRSLNSGTSFPTTDLYNGTPCWRTDLDELYIYDGTSAWTKFDASALANTPAGNIAATNVQAAINELDTEKEPKDVTILKDADIGVNVQAYDSNLESGANNYIHPSYTTTNINTAGAHAFVGHLTPLEMVRLGLITEDQLLSYNLFGFVREPLDRWISGFFFARSLMEWQGDPLEHMIRRIRAGGNAMNLGVFFNRPQRGWFMYEGEIIGTAYDYKKLNSTVGDIIEFYGESKPEEYPRIKSGYRPDWYKVPSSEFLPADCQDALINYLGEDIDFYSTVA